MKTEQIVLEHYKDVMSLETSRSSDVINGKRVIIRRIANTNLIESWIGANVVINSNTSDDPQAIATKIIEATKY